MSLSDSAAVSAWLLVALCAMSGAYCLLRARRTARTARGAASGEALMGIGMAVMAAPTGTGAWGGGVLLTVFCAAALHALWLLRGGVHHAHHLVGSLAMVYMAVTMAAGPGAAGGHGSPGGHGAGHGQGLAQGLPLVTGALLLYFAGYVLLGGARLVTAGVTVGAYGVPGPGAEAATPGAEAAGSGAGISGPGAETVGSGAETVGSGAGELTRACRLAMGIGMLAMLLTM
ncbi:DUF5134 domain-containing protein [Streptomyces sp. G-G2]|uniref:DUF5134 domain-containing protein n=1 Tax=Streptomyces sp. G-G2 TaxID=3046201 RepID=UPI0024B93B63|nr:DUF5134 domain-containing protein [Streptomyces sp. G-G2]MDJ0381166.1 DUF5134 domain-containing protein [Streptomyces sp. G-G2]